MNGFDTQKYYELTLDLTEKLCRIPAPSGMEEKRAEFIKDYLHSIGYNNAYIDNAKNVIWDIKGQTEDYVLFIAHTDTVFPDLEPLPYVDDGKYIKCPGVCDDTVCAATILAYCKYLKDASIKPTKSILFSTNSCEEGLGDLRGVKQIFKDFENKISLMFTLDGGYKHICNKSVGSHRFNVNVKTEGGHSYNRFGNRNAISVLAWIISKIYQIEVPNKQDTKTTYNVGAISGGTSVNTIAQEAQMLCEYRSDDKECFEYMQKQFAQIFDEAKKEFADSEIEIVLVGNRPTMGDVDKEKMAELSKIVMDIQRKNANVEVEAESGSTDCNIPHSLGIPAICVGTYQGGGIHTREEYLEKESVKTGVNIMHDLFNEFSK